MWRYMTCRASSNFGGVYCQTLMFPCQLWIPIAIAGVDSRSRHGNLEAGRYPERNYCAVCEYPGESTERGNRRRQTWEKKCNLNALGKTVGKTILTSHDGWVTQVKHRLNSWWHFDSGDNGGIAASRGWACMVGVWLSNWWLYILYNSREARSKIPQASNLLQVMLVLYNSVDDGVMENDY